MEDLKEKRESLKLKFWEMPQNLDIITAWAMSGFSIPQMATEMKVCKTTLYKWKDERELIGNAIQLGTQQGIAFAERMLMELIAEKNLGAIKFYLQTNCRSKYDNTADGLSYEVTRQARKNYKDYLEENGLVDDTDYGNDDCEC